MLKSEEKILDTVKAELKTEGSMNYRRFAKILSDNGGNLDTMSEKFWEALVKFADDRGNGIYWHETRNHDNQNLSCFV